MCKTSIVKAILRRMLSAMLAVTLPVSLWAQGDPGSQGAMLSAHGEVTVNARPIGATTAVFPGDSVQTQSGAAATLTIEGSSIVVLENSAARFEGSSVIVERGGVRITTQRGLNAQVGCIMLTPMQNGQWVEYTVWDNGTTAQMEVSKGQVTVTEGGKSNTLSAGGHMSRQDCAREAKERRRGAVPGATGGILDSSVAQYAGLAAVGTTLVIILTRTEEPVSPAKP
jgi:hypothetical protein